MQLAIVINGKFVSNVKLGESVKIENIKLNEKNNTIELLDGILNKFLLSNTIFFDIDKDLFLICEPNFFNIIDFYSPALLPKKIFNLKKLNEK